MAAMSVQLSNGMSAPAARARAPAADATMRSEVVVVQDRSSM